MAFDFTNEWRMGDDERRVKERKESTEMAEDSESSKENDSAGARERASEDRMEPVTNDAETPSPPPVEEGDVMASVGELDPEGETESVAAEPEHTEGEDTMAPTAEIADKRTETSEEKSANGPDEGQQMPDVEHDEGNRQSESDDTDEHEADEDHLMPNPGDEEDEGNQTSEADNESGEKRGADEGGRMDPASKEVAGTVSNDERDERRVGSIDEGEEGEGYVRLQVHVEEGKMSVVGVKAVEGPLVTPGKAAGELMYEVTRGGRPIMADTVTASSVKRSYPSPDEPGAPHTEIPMSELEFAVRIPREELSEDALSDLDISLYRAKESLSKPVSDDQPLAAQFDRQLREAARLDGIRLNELDEEVQDQLRTALK